MYVIYKWYNVLYQQRIFLRYRLPIDQQDVPNSLIIVIYYYRIDGFPLFNFPSFELIELAFLFSMITKKFQSYPGPNVSDKFFYSGYTRRFRGFSDESSSWADLMSLSLRSEQVWRTATTDTETRHDEEKRTRTRRRRKRKEGEGWLCCS